MKDYGTKIVMYGLLVETDEHMKQLEDGFKEMGFEKPKLIGKFKTAAGQGGEGGRSDVVLAVHDKDIGKLAVHPMHLSGGFSWADDYLTNNRDIVPATAMKFFEDVKPYETEADKPICKLTGEDGNIFNIIGRVSKALKSVKLVEKAKEFTDKALKAGSYDEVLRLAESYVEVE